MFKDLFLMRLEVTNFNAFGSNNTSKRAILVLQKRHNISYKFHSSIPITFKSRNLKIYNNTLGGQKKCQNFHVFFEWAHVNVNVIIIETSKSSACSRVTPSTRSIFSVVINHFSFEIFGEKQHDL